MALIDGPLDEYRDRKVLVFGASGFIGRRVVRRLSRAGARVGAVTRFAPAAGTASGATTSIVADLMHPGVAQQIVEQFRPSVTFNLAGYGVDRNERDAGVAARINSDFVSELLAACRTCPDPDWSGQQLIHAGSALEYGIASGDLHEETVPEPTTTYGRTKLGGTQFITTAVEAGLVRGVTARLFTVYGPGEGPGRLLPSLLEAARTQQRLALTAGTQRRDFTFVDDVAEGMLRLGRLDETTVLPVNLATGTLESVRRFAERTADVIGLPRSLLGFGELEGRTDDMHHADVSVKRLTRLCGWTLPTGIEAGVLATLAEWRAGETK